MNFFQASIDEDLELVVLQDSHPYSRTDFMLLLNSLSFVLIDMEFEFHTVCSALNA